MAAPLKISGAVVAVFFAAITFGLWAWINRPVDDPGWPERGLQGVTLSPFLEGQDPAQGRFPSVEDIEADLRLLSSASIAAVRTYSSLNTLAHIPRLAGEQQIKVTLGAWLNQDRKNNEAEIANVIELSAAHSSVIRVIVGNETLLREDLSVRELAAYLDRVRAAVRQPVSTAEPWHVWLKHPELAQHVDYVAVHLLPYWEGVSIDHATTYVLERMRELEAAFPDKQIVIAEIGWPSDGRMRENAVPSPSNQSLFLRRFLRLAKQEGYLYYIVEAFDQPWKARTEGTAGAYWGLYNVRREPKFTFVEPIVRVPGWQTLASISVAIAALLLGLFFVHSKTLGTRGRSLLAVVVYSAATALVLVVYNYSQKYLTIASALIGLVLILGMLFVIAVLLAEAHEWAEAHFAVSRRRAFSPGPDTGFAPKVSIHVPAYNEPPAMLIETLNALAQLEYPDFEVIVIDNNTIDEAVWKPVEQHCAHLGTRFRFYHVRPLSGFKAGALNFALRKTAPDAQIIAVIDSDYKVEPHWLKDLVPAFAHERTAIVQAPQDYRDGNESLFKAMCYAEYRGFFQIGMITRNERNAIIQHGTMTLVRRSALEQVDGWAEWCITEDAELGLKLFEHGHEAQYIPRSYGRGLIPESFLDYKKQRFRWAFGAMQILRAHARALLSPSDTRLTRGQRYHFIAGWLPWIADGFNLLFNFRRDRVVAVDADRAASRRAAARDVLARAGCNVHVPAREARASLRIARRSERKRNVGGRDCRTRARAHDRHGHPQVALHAEPTVPAHAERQAPSHVRRDLPNREARARHARRTPRLRLRARLFDPDRGRSRARHSGRAARTRPLALGGGTVDSIGAVRGGSGGVGNQRLAVLRAMARQGHRRDSRAARRRVANESGYRLDVADAPSTA